MGEDLAGWLRLREPADAAARSSRLTREVVRTLHARLPISILDLATGTGSNLRYLAPLLPRRQRWLLVDRDPDLLALVPEMTSSWSASRGYDVVANGNGCLIRGGALECRVETRKLDLGTLDDAEIFAGRHLVTASALLDLTSEWWLTTLADRCRAAGAAALFALTYNGWSACSPSEPEDDRIRHLLNQHQRRDKGLGGPALGPEAAACAERCFADVGYQVRSDASNWTLGISEGELQRQLIDGWAEAAMQMTPDAAATIEDWRMRRIGHVDANRSSLVVGHVDIGAWPRE